MILMPGPNMDTFSEVSVNKGDFVCVKSMVRLKLCTKVLLWQPSHYHLRGRPKLTSFNDHCNESTSSIEPPVIERERIAQIRL